LDEPSLAFSPDDTMLDVSPLRGLDRYGPYSSSTFSMYTPELRLATIGPAKGWPSLRNLVNTLRNQHTPSDRREYVPRYRGIKEVFGVPLVAANTKESHIKLPDDLIAHEDNTVASQKLIQALASCMTRLAEVREQFDVALVYLPDSWQYSFRSCGFDARDSLKALGASFGIPTQIINDRAISFVFKASLAWRLSIALYSKAGGIPWKLGSLAGIPEGTAYIGLAYALRENLGKTFYVTCCSQVFDADGGGMQFVAFEARDPVENIEEARKNPYLNRGDMRAVLARSLCIYQQRNGGVLPRRVVVHKTTSFKSEELEGALDAMSVVPEIECIEVTSSPRWRGVWLKQNNASGKPSVPDGYPVPRGTMLQLSGTSILVWVAGNAPRASLGGEFYQGKKSIPRPIKLVRYAGRGPLESIALEALALTKMDWNNDALYDPLPVTIRYAQRLAKTIANVPTLPGSAYSYRFFM
jgi:hypothetical protein